MKIIVLHGDDFESSYVRLSKFIKEAKKRSWDIVNDSIEDTPSLFGTEKLIIVRNYQVLTKRDLKVVNNISGTLVIYHQGTIPQVFLKSIKDAKDLVIEKFELKQEIWKFLDNITLENFHNALKTSPVEFIFAMLSTRFKELYWASSGKPPYPSWRIGKLKSQILKLKVQPKELIDDMAKIDFKVKTGKINLKSALDLLILKKLA